MARAPVPRRSPKAGQPPRATPSTPQQRRRQRTAQSAVRKDTMIMQTDRGPRARWPASRPSFKKG